MVIDTSALVAIFFNEPERTTLLEALIQSPKKLISVANVLEASIVLEARRGQAGARELDLFLHDLGVDLVAVDVEQLDMARLAYRKFGKGHSAAALNFGDCFAYALAQSSGEPLLAKGDDFKKTDIALAVPMV